ncbi:hypothetical protein P170DRAFT_463984 [Aspergillus steynii IBT 23096]|uniref:Fungal N-terminal domain-containing protein n=1 Tax=Aspergillus steynii IBT 23096 TaxID=1392250 RepID=A0A2I2GDN8_9EURO|nr:uncharacterized protein P170DRAFT_463984 [Aspergillus steynii IBT 23096]PLB50951.1 hypothetical protein P170DRAFT_463984 [Aspergillus steynii IBT 23096]
MDIVSGVFGILPPIFTLLKKAVTSFSKMEELLQDGSDLERLVTGLKEQFDGLQGGSFREDIPGPEKELYVLLEEKCNQLYHEMRQIKEEFQHGNKFLRYLSPAFQRASRRISKLQTELESDLTVIGHLDGTARFIADKWKASVAIAAGMDMGNGNARTPAGNAGDLKHEHLWVMLTSDLLGIKKGHTVTDCDNEVHCFNCKNQAIWVVAVHETDAMALISNNGTSII